MKLSSWILRVSLIAMVILSLVFTSLIWRNPSRLERRSTSNVQVTTENDPNVKKMEGNVYLHRGQKQLLFKANANIGHEVQQAMADWHMTQVKAVGKVSPANYET